MRAMALSGAFVLLVVGFWLGAVVANMTPEPATGYSRDLYAYFFPRFVYEARAVWAGRIPLWNPHELCGAPFLASAQSGVLNPLTVLVFGVAPAPVALHVYYVLHFLLAGFATYLFCRAADLGWQGAALASAAWTFSPALTRSIYHPNRIACLVWLPVIFLCADRLSREASLPRAVLLALVLALQACAGYPEFGLDTGILVGVAVLAGLATGEGRASAARVLTLVAAAAVLAVAVAGAQLLPTAELVRESARDVLTARPVLAPGPAALRTLFGLRRDVGLAYVSMLPALYLGALPLVLAACGGLLGRSRLRAPFAACALVCVVAVVAYRYLHLLPVFRLTRFALAWALLLPFFTAVLAGIGWDTLATPRTPRLPALGVLALVGAGLLAFGTRASVIFAVLAIGVGAAAGSSRRRGTVFAAALFVLLGDLFASLPYFGGTDPLPPLPRSATTRALVEAIRGRADELRFLGVAESYTGVALIEHLRSVSGLENSAMPRRLGMLADHLNLRIAADMPLRLDRVISSKPLLDLMGVAYVTGPARWGPALTRAGCVPVAEASGAAHGLWRNPTALPRAFLVRGVRVVGGASEAFGAVTSADFRPGEEVVVEEPLGTPIPPGSMLPGEGARVLRDAAEELQIEAVALQPAVLVVADSYFPGWEARVDDAAARIARADFAFRAVTLPVGRHTVTFTYRPRAFRVGARLSLAGLAVVAGVFASRVVASRRVGASSSSPSQEGLNRPISPRAGP